MAWLALMTFVSLKKIRARDNGLIDTVILERKGHSKVNCLHQHHEGGGLYLLSYAYANYQRLLPNVFMNRSTQENCPTPGCKVSSILSTQLCYS